MSEFIDRVARAIDPDLWRVQDGLKENCRDYWEMETQIEERADSMKRALSAIEAMRDPTNLMLDAGSAYGHMLTHKEMLYYWQTMIDAALEGAAR